MLHLLASSNFWEWLGVYFLENVETCYVNLHLQIMTQKLFSPQLLSIHWPIYIEIIFYLAYLDYNVNYINLFFLVWPLNETKDLSVNSWIPEAERYVWVVLNRNEHKKLIFPSQYSYLSSPFLESNQMFLFLDASYGDILHPYNNKVLLDSPRIKIITSLDYH